MTVIEKRKQMQAEMFAKVRMMMQDYRYQQGVGNNDAMFAERLSDIVREYAEHPSFFKDKR
jgi:hypothetical protein